MFVFRTGSSAVTSFPVLLRAAALLGCVVLISATDDAYPVFGTVYHQAQNSTRVESGDRVTLATGTKTIAVSATNNAGQYNFSAIPSGQYTIIVTLQTGGSFRSTVTVPVQSLPFDLRVSN